MKKSFLLALPAALLIIASCNQTSKTTSQTEVDSTANKLETQCYQAINGTDSAFMKVVNNNGKVEGDLAFNFEKKTKTKGTISGEFKGDTLFVDYNYTVNGVVSKNPFAFLKKDGKLYQGSGEILTYLGKTYFKKDSEIDFTKGFVFEAADCK